MKNRHVEELKRKAKQYKASQSLSRYQDGIFAYHSYDDLQESQLTWWDDVAFLMNDHRVLVSWIHPRMAFEEALEKDADRLVEAISSNNDWQKEWFTARAAAIESAQYEIDPYIKSRWTKFGKLVELCAPLEICNRNDLLELVHLTRKLLKRTVAINEVFPNYKYTKKNWIEEGLNKEPVSLRSHLLIT
jgi:hypothetical protein